MNFTLTSEATIDDYPNTNIWSVLNPLFDKYKSRTAVVCEKTHRSLTYGDVKEGSFLWASKFRSLSNGSKAPTIAVIASNTAEYPMILLGAAAVGSPITLIVNQYTTEMIAYILSNSGSSVVCVEGSSLEKLKSALTLVELSLDVIIIESDVRQDFKLLEQVEFSSTKAISPEVECIIGFSSGTTGSPKGIVQTQKSILASAWTVSKGQIFNKGRQEGRQGTVITSMLMINSFMSQIYCIVPFLIGDKLVVIDYTDFDAVVEAVKVHKPKCLYMRPLSVGLLMELDDVSELLDGLEEIVVLGLSPNVTTIRNLHEKCPHLHFVNLYGSTETSGISASADTNAPFNLHMKLLPDVKLQVRDAVTHQPLPASQLGEIWVHTRGTMKHYFNNEVATRNVFDSNRWVCTGDIGSYSEDGYISVVDRSKDVIITKGITIFPSKLENILRTHPCVQEVAVIGTPSVQEGQLPRAYIILKKQTADSVNEAELISYLNRRVDTQEERLTGGVRIVTSLPRNAMGKMLKRLIIEDEWETEEESTGGIRSF